MNKEGNDVTSYRKGGRHRGFVNTHEYVAIAGGWRVHKAVPGHNDYFDGTFRGRIYLGTEKGRLKMTLSHFNVDWNESLEYKLGLTLPFLGDWIYKEVKNQLINAETTAVSQFTDVFSEVHKGYLEMVRKTPLIRALAERATVSTRGTSIVLSFQITPPDLPGTSYPPE